MSKRIVQASQRGVTLTELLATIAILGVLAAILVPVLAGAKRRGQVESSVSRLKHDYLALQLYRDGEEAYPSLSVLRETWLGLGKASWESACGPHPSWVAMGKTGSLFSYAPGFPGYTEQLELFGGNAVLLADDQCNDADIDLNNPYITKLGLAALENGRIIRKRSLGSMGALGWYAPPAE
jgi:prepilin-type N-terminal cleavage/methylation domain-containing protein